MWIASGRTSSRAMAWLPALCDPEGRTERPLRPISAAALDALIDAAAAHGVLPMVARSLRALAAAGDSAAIVTGPDARQALAQACAALDEKMVLVTGQRLLLAHHADQISAAFARDALPGTVIKGAVFARRLYPAAADRGFTDIDVLLDHAALEAGGEILRRLGFVPVAGMLATGRDYREYKWALPEYPFVLVELQTDLIHSPTLRRGIHFRYSDLLEAGNGDPQDATALLVVAALHGAAGDQFERMQPAVDVLQAARGAAGAVDADRMASVASAIGAAVALQAALDLTAELFNAPVAAELAEHFTEVPWRGLRRRLVSPAVVLRAQTTIGWRDSWRRRALREMIRRIGAPRTT